MINDAHVGVKRLLREFGNIDNQEADISFDPPTKAFVDRLSIPTVNLFMFDLRENTILRQTSFHTQHSKGQARRRLIPRRFDLYYMVSAFSVVIEQEHALLWRTLVTLLKHSEIPTELLSPSMRSLNVPITTRIEQDQSAQRSSELWSAFAVRPRPTLVYILTVPVDLDIEFTSPLVRTITAHYSSSLNQHGAEFSTRIGGIITNHDGEPLAGAKVGLFASAASCLTDSDGSFILSNVPRGNVKLSVERSNGEKVNIAVEVPSDTYNLTID